MSGAGLHAGWLRSVLQSRGLPLLAPEVLRAAVAQLRDEQAHALRRDVLALQNGTEQPAQMAHVADVLRCLRPDWHAPLRNAGLGTDAGALVAALEVLGADAFFKLLRQLPDAEAAAALRPHLGAPAAPEGAAQAVEAATEGDEPAAFAAAAPFRPGLDDAEPDFDPFEAAGDWEAGAPFGTAAPLDAVDALAAVGAPATRALPRGLHVYGAKAALRVEEDRWRNAPDAVRCRTLRLEAAPALEGAAPGRSYDWPHKVAVQLTARELPVFVAVLLNLVPQAQGQAHGPAHDKWFEARRQAGGVLVRLGQGRRGFAVPVAEGDLYELTLLALDVLRANAPRADTAQVMAALQALAG